VVLGYVGAGVLESSGIRVPVTHDSVGPDGVIGDAATRESLAEALARIVAELGSRPRGQA
jgi:chromate reductase, NAD(P)H dehydrogenase (quinone)